MMVWEYYRLWFHLNKAYGCAPDHGHEEGRVEALPPEQVGQQGGQDEAGRKEAGHVVLVLEHHQGVGLQV